MLWRVQELVGLHLRATDGEIGSIDDVLFDDKEWMVRYFVVDIGNSSGRRVLLAPEAITKVDAWDEAMEVSLSQKRIEDSPEADLARPLTQEHLVQLHDYYGWRQAPVYVSGDIPDTGGTSGTSTGSVVGWFAVPLLSWGLPPKGAAGAEAERIVHERSRSKPGLHSSEDVRGYRIHATDQFVGRVADWLVSDGDWPMRYLLVDTRRWLPGKDVLVPVEMISAVDPYNSDVHLTLGSETIKAGPEYQPGMSLDDKLERAMSAYYGPPRRSER